MAYKKTAHRRRRVRSSRRKNAKSRKMMRGGDTNSDIRQCNAKGGVNAPAGQAKEYILQIARNNKINTDGTMCTQLVTRNIKWQPPYVRPVQPTTTASQ